MNEEVTLIKFCKDCGGKCCQGSTTIGVPILSKTEAEELGKKGASVKREVTPTGEYYVAEWVEKKRCPVLTKDNRCGIQEGMKPMDCLCYPIKAVPNGDSFKFLVDPDCPATKHLSPEFIENAKKIAIKSIERFDAETYQHWLDNYIGWIKYGIGLENIRK
jgi:Fe-S-cluster containining protein